MDCLDAAIHFLSALKSKRNPYQCPSGNGNELWINIVVGSPKRTVGV